MKTEIAKYIGPVNDAGYVPGCHYIIQLYTGARSIVVYGAPLQEKLTYKSMKELQESWDFSVSPDYWPYSAAREEGV